MPLMKFNGNYGITSYVSVINRTNIIILEEFTSTKDVKLCIFP